MFNLEQSITAWRQQMLAAGIKIPAPLEELESHLRDDVEQQIRSGLSAQQAFEAAAKRLGQANPLSKEFAKEPSTRGLVIGNLIVMFCVVCYGWGFMWLNSAEKNHTQWLLGAIAISLIMLMMGSSIFVTLFLHRVLPKARIRRIGRAGMIVAVLGWLGVISCRIAIVGIHGLDWLYAPLSQIFVWLFVLSNSIRMSARDKPSRRTRELAG
jgi:hypothetical protein